MSERTNKRTRVKKWWLDHVWHRLVLPLGEPEFFTESEVELAQRLYVADPTAAEALLAQAKEMDEGVYKTAESIETRAMTLQGAVAIATTLALAAAGLLLDRAKIPSHGWRIAFAVALALTVAAFIASGVRALGASSKTYAWAYPGYNDIFDHAKMGLTGAQAARAAAHLKSAGLNERIVSVKGGYLNAAVFWFRIALALLLASGVVLLAYSVISDPHAAKNTQRSKPVVADHGRAVAKCRPSQHPATATTSSRRRRRPTLFSSPTTWIAHSLIRFERSGGWCGFRTDAPSGATAQPWKLTERVKCGVVTVRVNGASFSNTTTLPLLPSVATATGRRTAATSETML